MSSANLQILSNIDKLPLDTLIYQCENPKGIVQICHGMSEHKERYIPFMKFLYSHGYIAIIHDHRGHGKSVQSSKDLGYLSEFGYTALVEDVKAVHDYIKGKYPKLPVIMFGHSMGSLIVRAYTKKYDSTIDKLIVCGSPSKHPLAIVGRTISAICRLIRGSHYRSKFIDSMAFSSYNKNFKKAESKNSWLCSNKKVVEQYDKDPLCGITFTTNGFYNLFDMMMYVYRKSEWVVSNRTLPIRFIAGNDDPCINNEKSFNKAVEFMRTVGYENVTSNLYPNMRHEILNERGKDKVYRDILNWIE